jgi:type III secretion protein V
LETQKFSIYELLLPLFLAVMIFCIIFVPPAWFLDLLLSANFILGLILLLSTFYSSNVLSLSSFPTIILLVTLYRLSLNICTTRLILEGKDAGEVVTILGRAISQGQVGIGLIIFIVISIVQFIVIAKGAERVAEVSARFALDAMPGKQMSIDAEFRSGVISLATAQKRREALQEESKFYGALDGAMKFVKGDAIAGLLIATINLCGGILAGIIIQDMSVASSFAKYGMLTIGDGLVSQIPALMNAVAAGVLVTKVSNGTGQTIAKEFPAQLMQFRIVRLISGTVCILLSLFSDIPTLPFVFFGTILLSSVFLNNKQIDNTLTVANINIPSILEIILPEGVFINIDDANSFLTGLEKWRLIQYEETGLFFDKPRIISGSVSTDILVNMRGLNLYKINIKDIASFSKLEWAQLIMKDLNYVHNELVDDLMTKKLLDSFFKVNGDTLSGIIPEQLTVTEFTLFLRRLVEENISIKNLDIILQCISENILRIGKGNELFQEIRIALARVISAKFSKDGVVDAISLEPELEFECKNEGNNSGLLSNSLVNAIIEKISNSKNSSVLVVSRYGRGLIKEYLKAEGINFSVVAYEELIGVKLNIVDSVAFSKI